ncbi:hypothetical protein [Mycobacterium leprae]|uniref:hypothetical protein n=1 Tax=Mycobacterium leprae TaxID=1769 RepID=UPI000A510096|nr:hypothetical protein [Mycobacterium leprae]
MDWCLVRRRSTGALGGCVAGEPGGRGEQSGGAAGRSLQKVSAEIPGPFSLRTPGLRTGWSCDQDAAPAGPPTIPQEFRRASVMVL